MKALNLIGQRFSRLLVIVEVSGKYRRRYWKCICDCGKETVVDSGRLNGGHTTSCGCYGKEKGRTNRLTHGRSYSLEYKAWCNMVDRCGNPKNKHFKDYGGRGIKVVFSSFEEFYGHMGERPQGMSLDRIDNEGNYEIGNVRWGTPKQQARNSRKNRLITCNTETMPLVAWSESTGIKERTIRRRLKAGWKVVDALYKAPRSIHA